MNYSIVDDDPPRVAHIELAAKFDLFSSDIAAWLFCASAATLCGQRNVDSEVLFIVKTFSLNVRLSVFQVFQSPWACSAEHEEQFARLMESLFHLEMDATTTVLMTLVVLFSPGHGSGINRLVDPEATAAAAAASSSSSEFGSIPLTTEPPNSETIQDKQRCIRTQEFFTQVLY